MLFYKNNKISKTFIFVNTLIALIIIISTVLLLYYNFVSHLETALDNTNFALLEQINQNVDMRLSVIDKNMLMFMDDVSLKKYMDSNQEFALHSNYDPIELQLKLINLINKNENITSIYLYSKVKNHVLTSSSSDSLDEFADRKWVESFESMESYFVWLSTRQIENRSGGESKYSNVITLVRTYPMNSKRELIQGAIIVNIDENMLNKTIDTQKSNKIDGIWMLNSDCQVILSSNKDLLYTDVKGTKYGAAVLEYNKPGSVEDKIDGIQSKIYFQTSPYTGWKYLSIIPKSQINRSINDIKNASLIIIAVMFGVSFLAMNELGRITWRPLVRFIQNVSQKFRGPDGLLGHTYADLATIEYNVEDMIKRHDDMKQKMEDSLPIIKWRFVMDIIRGCYTNYEEIKAQLNMLNTQLYPENYIVLVMEIDSTEKNMTFYIVTLCKIAEEYSNSISRAISVEIGDDRILLIMSCELVIDNKFMASILSVTDEIRGFMKKRCNISVSIGIGAPRKYMKDINKSYNEALEALSYKLISGNNTTILIDDVKICNEKRLNQILTFQNKIENALKATSFDEITILLQKLFSEITKSKFPPDMIRQLSMQLIMKGVQISMDAGLTVDELLGEEYYNTYEIMEQFATAEEIRVYIQSIFECFIIKLKEKKSERSSNDIRIKKILEYIEGHYMDDSISLNMLSEKFNLSLQYLSKMFKQETGNNYVDYIISLRIGKAQELLVKTDININIIAEKVGYSTYPGFLRIFKKYTGKSPIEYRNDSIIRNIEVSEEGEV